jgi:hypothetical protein
MEMITTEVVETGRKYDVKGRRLVAAAERAALLAAYDGCGLTQVEFARREGIKYSTFTTWLQERRHAARKVKEPAPKMRFEEVRLPAQGKVLGRTLTTFQIFRLFNTEDAESALLRPVRQAQGFEGHAEKGHKLKAFTADHADGRKASSSASAIFATSGLKTGSIRVNSRF